MDNSNANDIVSSECCRCGQPVEGMVALNVAKTQGQEPGKVCARCLADEHAKSLTSIDKVDEFIEEVTGSLASLERIITLCPQMSAIPQGMEGAMTPLSIYRTLQIHLAAYNSRRMELMAELDNKKRIEHEIEKAILDENYEYAAELKRRSEDLDK